MSITTPRSQGAASLHDLAASLELAAKTWSTLRRVGACACCAARFAGCREIDAFTCNERQLAAQLDSRFADPPHVTSNLTAQEPAANRSANSTSSEGGQAACADDCCALCLGLLQSGMLVRVVPRARPSSESHGDDARACVSGGVARSAASSDDLLRGTARRDAPAPEASSADVPGDARPEDTNKPCGSVPGARGSAAGGLLAEEDASNVALDEADIRASFDTERCGYRRMGVARAIGECAAERGYTITSFAIAAAVPACLAVHDAAILAVLREEETSSTALLSVSGDGTSKGYDISAAKVVSVKEALKLRLSGELQERFGGAPLNADSDFMVEVSAQAPEADARALAILLGEPKSPRPASKPGSGRWSKKRQRREEHRNPGLTVGTTKKGLACLDDAARARMRGWVESLYLQERQDAPEEVAIEVEGPRDRGDRGAEQEFGAETKRIGLDRGKENGNSEKAEHDHTQERPSCDRTNGHNQSGAMVTAPNVASSTRQHPVHLEIATRKRKVEAALCDVTIRRLPIHFWGRYKKYSRVVPQTPWIRGFFSVQEAIAEPFQEFSGCVEGMLHGAGREDVDVRMLGNGRPFSLELVDSLRTAAEVGARLPALAESINSGSGRKNAGGGVIVSKLRVAGAADLPSEVQKVGEGKRKHYRCVVWVSKSVSPKELAALSDLPEVVVQQTTPLRVLHRRTLLDRPRSIYDMRAEWINDHFFVLDLATSAGTYIKEFVHGDLGRTVPSVGSLLDCRADILQLDVTLVEDKWSILEKGAEEQEAGTCERSTSTAENVVRLCESK